MEEHGEIFANIDSESSTFLARIESRCLEAAQTIQCYRDRALGPLAKAEFPLVRS